MKQMTIDSLRGHSCQREREAKTRFQERNVMKTVILAGGLGSRLQEETHLRPKPMIEIGGQPIIWHIMKHYAQHNFDDFYIALGYLGQQIKHFFVDKYNLSGSISIDFEKKSINRQRQNDESWKVNLIETGAATMTGGRVLQLKESLGNETFMLTYGDGVSNIDLQSLLTFHQRHGRLATVTAVRPPARFGGLELDGDEVANFTEKAVSGDSWINGGFLVFEPQIFDFIAGDDCILEKALEQVAAENQLMAYKHAGFWQCMDTLRDKNYLQDLWDRGSPPWRTWGLEVAQNQELRLYAA